MPVSPRQDTDGVVRVSVTSNGSAIPTSAELISVRVQRAANTVPSARLIVNDGDMSTGTWDIGDAATFAPGAAIVIKAGYGDQEERIFEGVVVKLGARVDGENYSRLIVDCQDKSVKMTIGRKNANFLDQTDGDIIQRLAGDHGLSIAAEATTVTFKELVQYYCSDWDFMVARAEANGLLVIATDGALSVKPPDVDAEPALQVVYGDDLIEFQGEIDARIQLTSVQATAWDPKTQAIVQGTAASPATLNAQGDLTSATLAQVASPATFALQTATPLESAALTGWAKAQQVKAGLARVRGSIKFQGSAKAKVGGLIELKGVGKRYEGKVFVGALVHEIADGNWITDAEFGLPPHWFIERHDVVAPAAAGWLPGAEGLQVGVVVKLDADPQGEQRIQVNVPVLDAKVWARLAQYYASNTFGAFFLPEIGDEVVLGYFNNDPTHPVILGSLYSSKHAPPYTLEAANNTKALVTRSKCKIEINDEDKVITITTPANNKVVLSDKDKSITLEDETKNKVTLTTSGITLDSPKDIVLTAKVKITMSAVNSIEMTAQADLKGAGLNVNFTANVGFAAKGAATAELSAAGQTTVKGAMVMIN